MIPLDGQPILTAAQMRSAEAAHGDLPGLMERAGAGVADAVRRLAAGAEALILCGPGNNGGDGYVAARILRDQGLPVRIAALCPPRSPLAIAAHARWGGPVTFYTGDDGFAGHVADPWRGGEPATAPILVDALFGTGARGQREDASWIEDHRPLFAAARLRIAIDLPGGIDAEGHPTIAGGGYEADITLALGALKPAHALPSGPGTCGRIGLIDLGLELTGHPLRMTARPHLPEPTGASQKFNRGMIAVIAGAMPGAALLAATAAARAGAGYVVLCGEAPPGPAALVRRPLAAETLADERLNVIVVGPGLGRGGDARPWLECAWGQSHKALVVDGDALHLLDRDLLTRPRAAPVVLTPHAGEYRALRRNLAIDTAGAAFPEEAATVAALGTHAHFVLVRKGATTIITDGRQTRVTPPGDPWLSTAGSGDVLAGTIAATLAGRGAGSPVEAAAAGVWLHARAARACGRSFIADDLATALSRVR